MRGWNDVKRAVAEGADRRRLRNSAEKPRPARNREQIKGSEDSWEKKWLELQERGVVWTDEQWAADIKAKRTRGDGANTK